MDMKGSSLHPGNNTFTLHIDFADLNGVEYSMEEQFQIDLVDVTAWQRIKIWFKGIDRGLRKLFK